jgi:hypothetical protein
MTKKNSLLSLPTFLLPHSFTSVAWFSPQRYVLLYRPSRCFVAIMTKSLPSLVSVGIIEKDVNADVMLTWYDQAL